MVLHSQNQDLITHHLTGKQILNWSESSNGGDFWTLVQLLPLALIVYVFTLKDSSLSIHCLIQLWCLAGCLTQYLYMPYIEDLDQWGEIVTRTSEEFISLWSLQWGLETIKSKTKFHHLSHLAMWTRQFGPPIIEIAEVNEAVNKYI